MFPLQRVNTYESGEFVLDAVCCNPLSEPRLFAQQLAGHFCNFLLCVLLVVTRYRGIRRLFEPSLRADKQLLVHLLGRKHLTWEEKKSIHLNKHQVGNKTLRGKLPVNQDLKDEVWLTFDESLSHQVIIHRLCNDLRHFIAVKLDESVTFAVTSLQTNRERNKVTVTDSQMFSFPPDVCWHMGFITLITGRAGDKLNVPEYSRLSYLTSDHFYIWDHFQSQPKLQILRSGASNRLLPGLLKPK